jgi:hypothetical protein
MLTETAATLPVVLSSPARSQLTARTMLTTPNKPSLSLKKEARAAGSATYQGSLCEHLGESFRFSLGQGGVW